MTPKDTEASTEPKLLSNCHKAPVVICEGGAWDVKSVRAGSTYFYGCTKCHKACDLFVAAKDVISESSRPSETGTSQQANPPVALERGLKEKIEKILSEINILQVPMLDDGTYFPYTVITKGVADAILTELTHTIEEAVVAELKRLKANLEGIGSRGDKVNGDPKFMMGIEIVEDHITDRIKELEGLQETK